VNDKIVKENIELQHNSLRSRLEKRRKVQGFLNGTKSNEKLSRFSERLTVVAEKSGNWDSENGSRALENILDELDLNDEPNNQPSKATNNTNPKKIKNYLSSPNDDKNSFNSKNNNNDFNLSMSTTSSDFINNKSIRSLGLSSVESGINSSPIKYESSFKTSAQAHRQDEPKINVITITEELDDPSTLLTPEQPQIDLKFDTEVKDVTEAKNEPEFVKSQESSIEIRPFEVNEDETNMRDSMFVLREKLLKKKKNYVNTENKS